MLMDNRKIEVKVGRTINLGNYESERIDVSLGGRLAEGESASDNIKQIHELLLRLVNEKIAEIKDRK
jgi:hypothetical protein